MIQRERIFEMDVAEQEALLSRAEQAGLAPEDVATFRAVFDSFAYVGELVIQQRMSIDKLRKILLWLSVGKEGRRTGSQIAESE